MAVDIDGVTDAIFARLKTDAAGANVRAALGASSASILHAEQLKQYTNGNAMPARPLIALRGNVVSGQSMDMRTLLLTWWIYDDPSYRYSRINPLLTLIEQAFPRDAIAFGRVSTVNISQENTDGALGGLTVRSLQLAYVTRG